MSSLRAVTAFTSSYSSMTYLNYSLACHRHPGVLISDQSSLAPKTSFIAQLFRVTDQELKLSVSQVFTITSPISHPCGPEVLVSTVSRHRSDLPFSL